MLPIGSVGRVIFKSRKDSDARQALRLLTIIRTTQEATERGRVIFHRLLRLADLEELNL
jgi:hypothetical protein